MYKRQLYARSVSYGFCAHYGIQPENYSFQDVGMILRGCNNRELKKHLETIRTGLGTLLAVSYTHLDVKSS